MIRITRLNGEVYWLNPHLIESVAGTPDTTITLTTGKKLVVREKPEEVLEAIVAYRRRLGSMGQEA